MRRNIHWNTQRITIHGMDCETQWLLSYNTTGSEYTNWEVCPYFSKDPGIRGNTGCSRLWNKMTNGHPILSLPWEGGSIFTPKSGDSKYWGDDLGVTRKGHKECLLDYWTGCSLWYGLWSTIVTGRRKFYSDTGRDTIYGIDCEWQGLLKKGNSTRRLNGIQSMV